MKPLLQFEDLGNCEYEKAHDIQQMHFDRLVNAKKNRQEVAEDRNAGIVLFCEHPPVYTIGRYGSEENLIADRTKLKVDVHRIGRGGDITYHGPGQIVGYPILDLEKWPMGLAAYVNKLEESIILTLKDYGLNAMRATSAPGVWLDCETPAERKICALGIKASRWVTMHGFAFNVNTDLSYFNQIIPCGIPDKAVTSLSKELGREIDMKEVKARLLHHIASVFEISWKEPVYQMNFG